MSYTKLANSILTSTIWMEDDHTRLVWVALLAMADKNGEVQASIPGLANVARVPIESVQTAIEKFLAPDPFSRTSDAEGRRIEIIRGGWSLINHGEYRKLASEEDRRAKAAERQQRARDRKRRDGGVTGGDKSHQIPQAEAEADSFGSSIEEPAASAPLDLTKALFDSGLKILTATGLAEQQARGLIGKWRKDHGDEAVLVALGQFQRAGASEPVAWITATLKARKPEADAPKILKFNG